MQNLKLENPLVLFDLETTGTKPDKDRIVEIAMIKIQPDGSREILTQRVNPLIPIPVGASEVHGITDKDVQNMPRFADIAQKIIDFIGNADIGGFNVVSFDLPLLLKEFERASVVFSVSNRSVVDAMKIFHLKEPRNLTAAYKFYCKKELLDAHSAKADILATAEILDAQLGMYEDLPRSVKELGALFSPGYVDQGRKFVWKNAKITFTFGKYRGKTLQSAVEKDRGYLEWMLTTDFPMDTKQIIRDALAGNIPGKK